MGYPYIKISALKWCPKTYRNNVQSRGRIINVVEEDPTRMEEE